MPRSSSPERIHWGRPVGSPGLALSGPRAPEMTEGVARVIDSGFVEVRSLVDQALSGDETAMKTLVQRYERIVFGFCVRILRHYQDAEDVAQETMIRMLKSLHRWDRERRFEPWLMAIAANRCRTLLAKRAKRGPHFSLADRDVPSRASRFDQLAWKEEIDQVLDTLRPQYRSALLLFHSHHLSYAEIAEALDVPIGTVRIWIHRARKEIWDWFASRDMIEECGHAVRRV